MLGTSMIIYIKNDSFHPNTGKFRKDNGDGDVGSRRTRCEAGALGEDGTMSGWGGGCGDAPGQQGATGAICRVGTH